MATNNQDITIKIRVDDDGVARVFNEAGDEAAKFGKKSEKAASGLTAFKGAALAASAAVVSVGASMKVLVDLLDRAQEIEGVSAGFTNLQGGAAAAQATLEGLQDATKGLVSDFDLMQQANQAVLLGLPTEGMDELAEAATKLGAATGRTAKEALGDLITGLGRASPLILDNLGITIKASEAQEIYAASVNKTVKQLTEEEKAQAFRFAAMEKIRSKSAELSEVQETGAVALTRARTAWTNLIDTLATAASQAESVTAAFNALAFSIDSITDLISGKLFNDIELAKLEGELRAVNKEMQLTGVATKDAAIRYFELDERATELSNQIAELKGNTLTATIASNRFNQSLKETSSDAEKATASLKKVAIEAPKILSGKRLDGGDVGGVFKTLFGDLFGDNVSTGIEEQVGANITNAIGSAITNIDPSDIRGSIAGGGGAIGQSIGQALGTAVGGPAGGALGSAIGDQIVGNIFEGISKIGESTNGTVGGLLDAGILGGFSTLGFGDKIADALGFGGKNAGEAARDKADAFFEDLLDENRVSLVINGQLQEIRDIAENDFNGFFESLDTSTETGLAQFGGFDAIGRALETQLGVADDIGGQIGAILGNNVGGSLNNLQILFQELGISQQDLAAGIEESWLAGDVSAGQFLETQRQIENLYAKGIPDGVGRTDLAFQNLIESGGAGRQVVDALGDAAIEAQEKGITTLEGLKEELIASGADAEKVSQAFNAIAAAGITTLDGLADVSVQSAAVISSQLESTGTFFEDVTASLEEIQQRLDNIKDKEINITYNVKTNVDDATREFGLGGDLPTGEFQTGAVQ